MSTSLKKALEAWRNIVGDDHVLVAETVAPYLKATFALEREIPAVVLPKTRDEVCNVVKIANCHRVPLYPISAGKNWGLGSRLPTADGCVILDLSRMKQIVNLDTRFGYITVEPGVTFQEASDAVRAQTDRYILSIIGGSPRASLVGNALERGDSVGHYGDRFNYCCAMEIVLPDGSIVFTGMNRFEHSKTKHLHRWGVGPWIDGLFSQSNLGIVTQMTFWLPPAPQHLQLFNFNIGNDAEFKIAVDGIRELMKLGIVKTNSFAIWNHLKFATAFQGKFSPEMLQRVAQSKGWIGSGAITSASALHAMADRKLLQSHLAGLSQRPRVLGRNIASIMKMARTPLKKIFGDKVEQIIDVYWNSVPMGIPTEKSVGGVYFRNSQHEPGEKPDPDRDECGLLWLCPAVPFDGDSLLEASLLARTIYEKHQLDPCIAITFPSERVAYLLPIIVYDRAQSGADENAMNCHDEMMQAFNEHGYVPYRLGVQSMDHVPPTVGNYAELLSQIKKLIDPHNIIAPNRYSN